MEKIKTDYKRRNWNLRLQLSTWANRDEARAIVYFLRRLLSHCFFHYPKKEKCSNIVFILRLISIGWQGSVDLEKFANPEWNLTCTCRTEYDYSLVCLKALANEDTLLPTQMSPRLPARATFVADFVSGTQKMFLIFRNILCPQQMFPSLRSPRNIMGNNVSATMCPRLPGPWIMWNFVFIVLFWFYTFLRLFYPRRTPSEACVYPCYPSGFGCGWGVPCLPGFTLYSSDNPLRSRVLPEVYRGCHQDVGGKPSLPSLSRLHQSGCVGRGPPRRRGYGWSRWIWRMALKFKGNDSLTINISIVNRMSLSLWRSFAT